MFRLSPISLLSLSSSFALYPARSYWLASPAHFFPSFVALDEVQVTKVLFLALLLSPMYPGASPFLSLEVSFSICKMKRMPRHLSPAILVPAVVIMFIYLALVPGRVLIGVFWGHLLLTLQFPCFLLLSYLHVKKISYFPYSGSFDFFSQRSQASYQGPSAHLYARMLIRSSKSFPGLLGYIHF